MTSMQKLLAGSVVGCCPCPRCDREAITITMPAIGWAVIRCDPCEWRASLRVDEEVRDGR